MDEFEQARGFCRCCYKYRKAWHTRPHKDKPQTNRVARARLRQETSKILQEAKKQKQE